MNIYAVRVHDVTLFLHYKDFELESNQPLEAFASMLAAKGFLDEKENRWIMPGAIAWIQRVPTVGPAPTTGRP